MTYIVIATFGRVKGVEGWIRVNSHTDPPENIWKYDHWLDHNHTPLELLDKKTEHNTFLVKVSGFETRESAKLLTNQTILIQRDQLPELPTDEYYWIDLIGLKVFALTGKLIGTITEIMPTASNDVLVIKTTGGEEHLVPYIENVIETVDIENGKMIIDWVIE